MRTVFVVVLLLGSLGLAGCETLNPKPKVDVLTPTSARPVVVAPTDAPPTGSIFQAASYRPLYEDHRARLVGDTITVQIVEVIAAKQSSTSSVDRTGQLSGGIKAFPLLAPNSFGRASVAGDSQSKFAGQGSTQNSNDFSGTITATVVEVLANGHLVITGEKQIGVNDSVDTLRFSGQVDPRSIVPGNVVPSASIANVRVEQRGRGAQAEAQRIGWLSRFFLNLLPI
jgi:flagellar L-ring protein precursor FlgH